MTFSDAARELSRITDIDFEDNPEYLYLFMMVQCGKMNQLWYENQALRKENDELEKQIQKLKKEAS